MCAQFSPTTVFNATARTQGRGEPVFGSTHRKVPSGRDCAAPPWRRPTWTGACCISALLTPMHSVGCRRRRYPPRPFPTVTSRCCGAGLKKAHPRINAGPSKRRQNVLRPRLPFVSVMVDIVFPFRKMSTKPDHAHLRERQGGLKPTAIGLVVCMRPLGIVLQSAAAPRGCGARLVQSVDPNRPRAARRRAHRDDSTTTDRGRERRWNRTTGRSPGSRPSAYWRCSPGRPGAPRRRRPAAPENHGAVPAEHRHRGAGLLGHRSDLDLSGQFRNPRA